VLQIQTQEAKNISKQKMAISFIRSQGPINRYKLAVLLGMNARSYNTFHSFLKEAYDHIIQYDSETKIWTMLPIEKPVIEEEECDSDETEPAEDTT